jgi:hypothetical protein
VSYPDEKLPKAERDQLSEPYGELHNGIVHEVYPGHWIQALWADQAPTTAQKLKRPPRALGDESSRRAVAKEMGVSRNTVAGWISFRPAGGSLSERRHQYWISGFVNCGQFDVATVQSSGACRLEVRVPGSPVTLRLSAAFAVPP